MTQLARDANVSLLRGNYCLCRWEGHTGAADEIPLVFPSIKFVEDHRLFKIVDTGAAIGDACRHGIARKLRRYRNGLVLRRIEIRIVDQLPKRFSRAFQIGANRWKAGGDAHVNLASSQCALAVRQRSFNDFIDRSWSQVERNLTRFQLSHFSGFFDEV